MNRRQLRNQRVIRRLLEDLKLISSMTVGTEQLTRMETWAVIIIGMIACGWQK